MSISASRNAPLSPISLGGSEFSVSKYQAGDDAPYPNGRSNLASPPNSGGSSINMSMNGFPSAPRSNGGPSPPASIARSSQGTNLYARSDSGRNSVRADLDESILSEHYVALRAFLNTRDPNHKHQPNKARDKLLRLSSVQFYELSTDVFDELIRRQAAARAPPNAPNPVPTFLLPEKNFHPKRNQARQRLSSLGPPRFRDLAADVFHELERRFPNFVGGDLQRQGSPMSIRGGPVSRTGTPVNGNGNGFPPRGQSRMRRPSDAPSMRGPPPPDAYGIPASPGIPNGDYGRPTPKQLNQNNTIVPNKSTMLEEDDEGDSFALEQVTSNHESKRSGDSGITSEADKKLIEDYQAQIQDLQGKLDGMEDVMRKKEEEMNSALDQERARSTATGLEKQEWSDLRLDLENKLAKAQNLNDSMEQELQRVRDDHDSETQQLRDQVAAAQQSSRSLNPADGDSELQRENEDLRNALEEQRQVTEEVRREAEEFLREMRMLSQQSGSTYERQAELEKNIEQLEHEVREWRNRYARTKTQLRNMRASSMGAGIEHDAAKFVRDKGFADDRGLVKDVHVTKFQIAIDELLQKARTGDPENVIDAMKSVVVGVRRITKDTDVSQAHDEEMAQQQKQLRTKVSATANNLITASKNFAAGAGISPVSLLDAAASHLSVAIVDLLRLVKIRATPTDELDDDENEGTITPVESTGFFSPLSTDPVSATQGTLPLPPPFQGLGTRASADSSAYSPVNSPRHSTDPYSRNGPTSKSNGMTNGMGYPAAVPSALNINGPGAHQQDTRAAEDLRIYLEDQNALLVSEIQNLVGTVRGDANIRQISADIGSISAVVGKIITEVQANGYGDMANRLADCRARLLEAGDRGEDMANIGVDTDSNEWRMWTQTLPPISFETARETKELVQRMDRLANPGAVDEFS